MLVFETLALRHIQSMLHAHWLFFMVPHRINEKNWCHPNACPMSFVMLESAETKKPGHKWLKNDSKIKQVRVCTNLFESLSSLLYQQSEWKVVWWQPWCHIVREYWAALPCLSVLSCPHEEKVFRGSLIMPFVPLWWVPPQSQAPQTSDFVLGSALPSTFQCFLLESQQLLSAGSHAVSVSFTIFLLLWWSFQPGSCYLKWCKIWCRGFIFRWW